MGVQLYNSLSRRLEPLAPQEPGHVRMYVCGMTVYDLCHIGHARAMIAFDVVYRYLKWRGYQVTYVRNYTDVDDKIIARAAELGENPLALSQRFIDALDADLGALGLDAPTHQPKVSDSIQGIVDMTAKLIANGHAYAADNGDVYYAVDTFEGYGKLSGKKLDDLRAGERVAVDPNKRNPADFALWKAAKDGEVAWDSPWGRGRPGWHIECSVMSTQLLGDSFDIHGGGIDLIFPHHENEIAQTEGATGHAPFARYWMHNGHLTLVERDDAGEWVPVKMSKSLGNVINIRDAVAEYPAEALKLFYVQTHYRSPLPYSHERMNETLGLLNRLYEAKEKAQAIAAKSRKAEPSQLLNDIGGPAAELWAQASGFKAAFTEAMDQDFNTAKGVSLLLELVRTINRVAGHKHLAKRGASLMEVAVEAFEIADAVLGIGGMEPQAFFDEFRDKRSAALGIDTAWVDAQLVARTQARESKDWAAADSIRDALLDKGVQVMDVAGGVTWRVQV